MSRLMQFTSRVRQLGSQLRQHGEHWQALRDSPYQGQVAPGWETLAQLFAATTAYEQIGATGGALAVSWRGKTVLNIHAGYATIEKPWQADTLALGYSTGKALLATLAHRLVEQGWLHYDQPLVHHWPEFGQHGKSQITLRHLLSHQSGLHDIRHQIADAHEMLDWSHMATRMAQMQPQFAPGTQVAYQALTYGYLLGHVLEKATNRPLADLLAEELAAPLDLKDQLFFGVPKSELDRVARLDRTTLAKPKATRDEAASPPWMSFIQRAQDWHSKGASWLGHDTQAMSDALYPPGISRFDVYSDEALQACMPSLNGVMTVTALMQHYTRLAAQGRGYLSRQTFDALSEVQSDAQDRVMPLPMNWRLGYHRVLTLGKTAPRGLAHIGYNGSGGWCDPDRQLAFAYLHNRPAGSLNADYRLLSLTQCTLMLADALK